MENFRSTPEKEQIMTAIGPRLPGTDVLGYGYDATKHYANAASVTLRIFDLGPFDSTIAAPNGITYALPSSIEDTFTFTDISHGSYHHISGETAEEYRKSLSIKAEVSGSYGLFSGSVKTHYEKSEMASFNHSFVTLYHHYDLWKIGLPDITTLKMLPSAKADIEGIKGMSPMGVIKKYGTHVVADVVIGGRARYTSFVDRSKYTSSTSLLVAAEASYKGMLNLDAKMETQYKEAVDKFRSSARTEFDTIGGDFKADFNPTRFEEWINSFKAHPVLVDFTERSLIEIFKLASDEHRREELKTAFIQYIKDSEKLVPDDIQLLEVEIVPAQSVDLIGTDSGSGAKQDLAVYKPKIPSGWCWVGQSGNFRDGLIRVKPLVPGAVTEPLGYQSAWNDAGSGKDHGYSLWNISPPPHYRALGGIARLGKGRTDWKQPSGGEVTSLCCVHESLCTEGEIGGCIWNDRGTHAKANGSVWAINPKDNNGTNSHTFYSQSSHGKPNVKVYVIKKGGKVKITND